MKIWKMLAVAAMLTGIAGSSMAVTLPFASFSYVGPGRVSYDNATGVFSSVNIPIDFNFISTGVLGTPGTGFGSLHAHINFTATATQNVAQIGTFGEQQLNLTSLLITLDTPLLGQNMLLSGTSNILDMLGKLGGSTVSIGSSVSGGATLSYLSDFLNFPAVTDADLSWSLTSLAPTLSISGNNFASFDATVSGVFGYNPSPAAVTPEPGVVSMAFGVGIAASAFMWRRRSKVTPRA